MIKYIKLLYVIKIRILSVTLTYLIKYTAKIIILYLNNFLIELIIIL